MKVIKEIWIKHRSNPLRGEWIVSQVITGVSNTLPPCRDANRHVWPLWALSMRLSSEGSPACTIRRKNSLGFNSLSSGLMKSKVNKSVVRWRHLFAPVEAQCQVCRKSRKKEEKKKTSDGTETDAANEPFTYLLFNFLKLVALFADVVQQLHGLVVLPGDLHSRLFQAPLQALQTHMR